MRRGECGHHRGIRLQLPWPMVHGSLCPDCSTPGRERFESQDKPIQFVLVSNPIAGAQTRAELNTTPNTQLFPWRGRPDLDFNWRASHLSGLHPQVMTERKKTWIGPKLWCGGATAGTSRDCPCRSPPSSTPRQPLQHSARHAGRAVVGTLPQNHTKMSKLISQAHNCTVRKPYLSKTWPPHAKVMSWIGGQHSVKSDTNQVTTTPIRHVC